MQVLVWILYYGFRGNPDGATIFGSENEAIEAFEKETGVNYDEYMQDNLELPENCEGTSIDAKWITITKDSIIKED